MTSPQGCPACAAPLMDTSECPSCGLPLRGPYAAQLWQVDQQLLSVDRHRAQLAAQREDLIARLRNGEVPPAPVLQPPTQWPDRPLAFPPKESSPQQVQNTLLVIGALLLAGAGIVFTSVTYRHLGVVGRASILLALTAAAAWAPRTLLRRGLTASAEAVGGVLIVLGLLDAYALRRAGVGQHVEAASYWTGATLVLAGLLAAYSTRVPVRVTRWSAALLAQLPLPLLLGRLDASASAAAVLLTGQAAADLYVAAAVPFPRDVRRLLAGLGFAVVIASLNVASVAVSNGERGAFMAFLALAGLAVVGCLLARSKGLQDAAAVPVVPLLALSAWAAVRPRLTGPQEPLVPAAVAVLGLQVVGLLPRARRDGAAWGALAVTGVALMSQAEAVATAVFGPLTWLTNPWSAHAVNARGALGESVTWDGTVVTLAVLAAAAVAVVTAGLVLDELRIALPVAGGIVFLSAVVLPLGFATSYRDALVLQLVLAGSLAIAGIATVDRWRLIGLSLVTSGIATSLLAAAWSVADETATLAVLPVAAVLCGVVALRVPGGPTSMALLLGAGELAAGGAHRGLAADQVGGLLLLVVALCAALGFVLRDLHRLAAELSSTAIALAAMACAASDPGWFSWILAGTGVTALAVSVHRDRRAVGLVGGLLLSASSWVRLADANVHAPEPYVAPLAAAALVAGVLRRRTHPSAGSWECYGTGLSLALVPSFFQSLADDSPARGLGVLTAAVVVVLVGAAFRLQAPLVIGGVVAAVEALVLLAPYANALPRWILMAGVGGVVIGVAITYEQRLKDLQRLKERLDALT